jgi:hypothetical protein
MLPHSIAMKTAYELAMERLAKQSPSRKLTAAQKREIAELDSRCKAKLAELEIGLKDQIAQAAAECNLEEMQSLEQRLAGERAKLQADFEEKKERVRSRA